MALGANKFKPVPIKRDPDPPSTPPSGNTPPPTGGPVQIGTGTGRTVDDNASITVQTRQVIQDVMTNVAENVEDASATALESLAGGSGGEFGDFLFPRVLKDEAVRPVVTFHCLGGGSHDKGRITFPAPSSFVASDSASFSDQEMGFLAKKFADKVSSARDVVNQQGGASAVNQIKDMVGNMTKDGALGDKFRSMKDKFMEDPAGNIGKLAGAIGVREISKGSEGALGLLEVAPGMQGAAAGTAIAMGITVNKNITTEFTGVGTRSFSFQYELVPSSIEEGRDIDKIIKIFSRAIYPSTQNLGSVLRYPPKWEIEFDKSVGGAPLTTYPVLAQCYLESFQSTYNQNNSFHVDGTPVKTTIALSFKEDRALTIEDITKLENERGIGLSSRRKGFRLSSD